MFSNDPNQDKFFQELMKTKIQDQMGKLDSMTNNINDVFALLKDELGRAEKFEERIRVLKLMVDFVRPTTIPGKGSIQGSGLNFNSL